MKWGQMKISRTALLGLAGLIAERLGLEPEEVIRAVAAPSERRLTVLCRAAGLNLLAAAHQSRETRLFQITQSVPGLVWSLLIILASGLIGCMLVFAAEASTSKAVWSEFSPLL